jgi:Concanavalin A-like lectin/glucanases superfamily
MYKTLPRPGILTPARDIQRPPWPFAINRDSPQAEGLINWWPAQPWGGTTVYDLAGLSPGTWQGSPVWFDDVLVGPSLNVDGASTYVTTGCVLNTAGPFTISFWAFLISYLQLFPAPLQFQTDQTSAFETFWSTQSGGYNGVNFGSDSNFLQAVGSTPGSSLTGSWFHQAITYNGAGRSTLTNYALYLNGVAETLSGGGPYSGTTNATRFGFATASSTFFNGYLSDIRVYNRALSADEVTALFNPRTRWELYYPLRQRVWCLGAVPTVPVSKQLALPAGVGTALSMPGAVGTGQSLPGSVGTSIAVGGSL